MNSNRTDSGFGGRACPANGGVRASPLAALSIAALVAVGLAAHGADTTAPEITAQGFDIADVREVPLGNSGRLRIRFEVPDRIDELYIRERSFEVDLASTPDRDYFPLFGIERQVRQLTDVTLNFQPYINDKLETQGDYEFELRVSDRKGASASAVLLIRVYDDDQDVASLERRKFRFTRAGSGIVFGADALGISWKTVEGSDVVIELAIPDSPAARFFDTVASDYDSTDTKPELLRLAANGTGSPTLRLATARNLAAGSVFGVVDEDTPFIVKITGSSTALSVIGTTVTLDGEYKY